MAPDDNLPIVLHRRYSRLPLEIPFLIPHAGAESDFEIPPGFAGTTPFGRELIRKHILGIRKKLVMAGIELRSNSAE